MLVTIAGKGGVGKTTLAALLCAELAQVVPRPILVVDGDPVGALHLALGLPAPKTTIAAVRAELYDEARQGARFAVSSILREREVVFVATDKLHLLALGEGEGRTCYCAINAGLSLALRALVDEYPLVVLDNEAGAEHLSRARIAVADVLLLVTTRAPLALAAGEKIVAAAQSAGVSWRSGGLLVNRDNGDGRDLYLAGLKQWVAVPEEPALAALERDGRPVIDLDPDSPVWAAVRDVATLVLNAGEAR